MEGVFILIIFLFIGMAWYYLGRFVILMVICNFKWSDFVDEWEYEDTTLEQFSYMFFPISLIGMFIIHLGDKINGYN